MKKPKKILLIHPLGVNWIPGEKDMSRIANIMVPIGLLNLAAWVDKHGHTSAIHDCYAFPVQY
jgi:anaerobic magnesium-protoporphyrin IX monomethyl ester cyclase